VRKEVTNRNRPVSNIQTEEICRLAFQLAEAASKYQVRNIFSPVIESTTYRHVSKEEGQSAARPFQDRLSTQPLNYYFKLVNCRLGRWAKRSAPPLQRSVFSLAIKPLTLMHTRSGVIGEKQSW